MDIKDDVDNNSVTLLSLGTETFKLAKLDEELKVHVYIRLQMLSRLPINRIDYMIFCRH